MTRVKTGIERSGQLSSTEPTVPPNLFACEPHSGVASKRRTEKAVHLVSYFGVRSQRGNGNQRAMGALAIVESLDVMEDLVLSLGACVKAATIDQFEFEGAPEAFDGSIIVTVALAAHGGNQAGLAQGLAIVGAGVLNAAVGVQ
jgi:hypothetical protein